MTNSRDSMFKALVPVMVSVLFLCHIMGMFCLMVPPSATAAPTIQNLPLTHNAMATELGCSDTIHSSSERPVAEGVLISTIATSDSSAVVMVRSSSVQPLFYPQNTGLPLYTLLATFRI